MATKLTQIIDENIAEDQANPRVSVHLPKTVNPMTSGNEHLRDDGETVTRTPGAKDNEITGTRYVEIANRKFSLIRRNPYGFWYVQPEKGRTPRELSGVYTTVPDAEKAITVYINNKV